MVSKIRAFEPLDPAIPNRKICMWYCIGGCGDLGGGGRVSLDQRFYDTINRYVSAYLDKNEQPPVDIASTIINIAEDHMAGRRVTIKAGDYIAIRNHIRGSE